MLKVDVAGGFEALVDETDFELISKYRWHYCGGYARTAIRRKKITMHRLLTGFSDLKVDHINGNGLDNRRSNLRFANSQQNGFNRKIGKNNTSGYKGVYRHKASSKWAAFLKHNSKTKHLGTFDLKEDAARAYNEAARQYFGEFAKLNTILGGGEYK